MNMILTNIYGTNGGLDLEKTAAEMPEGVSLEDLPTNLSDLALMLVSDGGDQDIEKTAAAHSSSLQVLVDFDSAGRHVAQAEFSEMEKAASEGDTDALEEFFSDVEDVQDDREAMKDAIRAELARRGIQ